MVKNAGARLTATSRTCPVTGRPPPETTPPVVSITWPRVAVVEPISWPARSFSAAVWSELSAAFEQRVTGHQEGAERSGEHRDHDGDGRRQDEAGAEGHVSRRT